MAFLVMPVICLVELVAYGTTLFALPVLVPKIAADLACSTSAVIGAITIALLVCGVASTYVNYVSMKFGFHIVMGVALGVSGVGLVGSSVAKSLWIFYIFWIFIGIGMAGSLYDMAFLVITSIYRENAPNHISILTLFAGFSSSIFFPLTFWVTDHLGWRSTLMTFGLLEILVLASIAYKTLPRMTAADGRDRGRVTTDIYAQNRPLDLSMLLLFVMWVFILAFLVSVFSAFVVEICYGIVKDTKAAVYISVWFGFGQVAMRGIILFWLGNERWAESTIISGFLIGVGIAGLHFGFTDPKVAVLTCGAGCGMFPATRAVAALNILGRQTFMRRGGILAALSVSTQALSPLIAGKIDNVLGVKMLTAMLLVAASLALLLAIVIFSRSKRQR